MYRLACITAAVSIVAVSAVGLTSAAPPLPSQVIAYVGKIPKLKTYALYTINTDGSDRQLITPKGRVTPGASFSWSPDGTQITYSRGELPQIVVRDLRAGVGKQLTSADVGSSNPSFSPDGKLIAFERYPNAYESQIWLMNADGSDKRPLTNSRQYNEEPDARWDEDHFRALLQRLADGDLVDGRRRHPEAEDRAGEDVQGA